MSLEKLRPMLAHDVDHLEGPAPWGDPGWVMEHKYDGIRIVWSNTGGRVQYYARSGNDHTGRYDFLADLALPADTVLDGEILVPGGISSDAAALKNRSKLIYVAFDVTQMDGHDLRPLPWQERREVLEMAVEGLPRVEASATFEPVKAIADQIVADGGEGVVLKKRQATYREGIRTFDWLKRKAAQEYDCVITDCDSPPTPGSLGDRSGWCVLSYGFFINGALVQCGSVGQSEPQEVQERKVGKVAVIKANGMLNVEEGTLRHPRILRFRDDKKPEDCTI